MRTVIFLHAVPQGPEAWTSQIDALPEGFTGRALPLLGTRDAHGVDFRVDRAVAAILSELDDAGLDRVDLCGLSVGAMVATQFVLDHPERVSSLVLSGSQMHTAPWLIKLQLGLLQVAWRAVAPPGMSKQRLLSIVREIRDIDTRGAIRRIDTPTLVFCGAKDRPNLRAAREIAAGIHEAELQIVPGAKHLWNTQMPEEFSRRLGLFLTRQTS